MKLCYATGACSLADRIALHEAGLDATFERVDLRTRRTETGADFLAINPKGYVPALVLDDGEIVTENIAVLAWIAGLEALAFVATEIHKRFKPFFTPGASDADRAKAAAALSGRFAFVAGRPGGPYLFGARFTVADAVTLRWARQFGLEIPAALAACHDAVAGRSHVRTALAEEGLLERTEPAAVRRAS